MIAITTKSSINVNPGLTRLDIEESPLKGVKQIKSGLEMRLEANALEFRTQPFSLAPLAWRFAAESRSRASAGRSRPPGLRLGAVWLSCFESAEAISQGAGRV